MIYKLTLYLVRFLLLILNGFIKTSGQENLPKDTGYILAAPHRSWIDPVMIAIAVYPQQPIFMAKKELFDHKLFGWFIKQLGAFPVNRQNPGPSAIKYPVSRIKQDKKALIIFPTGTRYSDEMKGGTTTIARLAKAPIVPVVYQGPFTFIDICRRRPMSVKIGTPLFVGEGRPNKENLEALDKQLQESFNQLDHEINPDFHYEVPKKK